MSRTAKRVDGPQSSGVVPIGPYVTAATIKNKRQNVGKNRRTIEKKRRRAAR